jgi:hypothetical protein
MTRLRTLADCDPMLPGLESLSREPEGTCVATARKEVLWATRFKTAFAFGPESC